MFLGFFKINLLILFIYYLVYLYNEIIVFKYFKKKNIKWNKWKIEIGIIILSYLIEVIGKN